MEPHVAQGLEWMESLIPELLRERVPVPERRREVMGAVWEHCFRALGEQQGQIPLHDESAFRAGLAGLVDQALRELRAAESPPRLRSGALGLFLDANLREVGPPWNRSPAALEGMPLVADALRAAEQRTDHVLQRNLHWMTRRDRGESYSSIAAESGMKEATVRTGVRRARREVRRIAYENAREANAPHRGQCPRALLAAREAWEGGQLDEAERRLLQARQELGDHPYRLYLLALVADDRGDREAAVALLSRVLVEDDDPLLRAKVLNCLGCIADDRGELEPAQIWWTRAWSVRPGYVAPALNLLKNACDRCDALAVHVAIDRIGELLSSGGLAEDDRSYLVERLASHPDLGFARRFDAWRRGPARWIARPTRTTSSTRPRQGRSARAAAGAGLALLLALPWTAPGLPFSRGAPPRIEALALPAALQLAGGGDRGARVPPRPHSAPGNSTPAVGSSA